MSAEAGQQTVQPADEVTEKYWQLIRQNRAFIGGRSCEQGSDILFIVTNLPGRAKVLYEKVYCARGRMENLIKDMNGGESCVSISTRSAVERRAALVGARARPTLTPRELLGQKSGFSPLVKNPNSRPGVIDLLVQDPSLGPSPGPGAGRAVCAHARASAPAAAPAVAVDLVAGAGA